MNADDLGALKGLGYTLHTLGNAEAIHIYLKVLSHDREDPYIYLNVGIMLCNQSRWDEALVHFSTAEKLAPDVSVIHTNTANALYMLGRFDEALTVLQRGKEIDSNNPEVDRILAQIYDANSDYDAAAGSYDAALENDPTNANIHSQKADLLMRVGKWQEAADHKTIAGETFAQTGNVLSAAFNYGDAGWALLKAGKVRESIQAGRKSLELDPTTAVVYFNIGLALLCEGEPDNALSEYKTGLSYSVDPALLRGVIADIDDVLAENSELSGVQKVRELLARHEASEELLTDTE